MKRLLKKTAAAAVALILTACVFSPAVYGLRIYDETAQDYPEFSDAAHREQTEQTEDTLIVQTDGTLPDFRALHPKRTVQGPDGIYTVTFSDAQEAADKLSEVCALPGVEYAEPNAQVVAQSETVSVCGYTTYGMDLMCCEKFAAALATRSDLQKVVVAVVDSGVQEDVPIFAGRLLRGATMTGASQTQDTFGHGTSIAGIVADMTQGLPVQILPVRVLKADGTGSVLDAANGIRYAAENGASVINISFVTAGACSQTLHNAVDYALARNALPVICTGNDALNLDADKCCPADYARGFVVSGCTRDLKFYSQSSYGSTVDLCAPAAKVKCITNKGKTQEKYGTSFSAAHISAIAALLKLYMPNAGHAALEKLLRLNTKDIGDPGFDTRFGWGLPDLSALDGTRSVSASRTITSVRFEQLPYKTTYRYKESFDASGLRIRVTYSDGSTEIRSTQGVQFYGIDSRERGTHTVRAVFDGHEAAFDVTIKYEWWQWLIHYLLFGWLWY